jgi:hypothetical protein
MAKKHVKTFFEIIVIKFVMFLVKYGENRCARRPASSAKGMRLQAEEKSQKTEYLKQ